jgi:phage protein D
VTTAWFVPQLRVDLDGAELPAEVARGIVELSVTQAADEIDAVRLTLANPYPDLRWTHTADADRFVEGAAIRVWMGYVGSDPVEMFDGELTGITPSFPGSGSPTLEVEGFNRLHRLQQRFDLIALQDATDGDMARSIADASGLTAQVDDPGTTYPQLSTGRAAHLRYLMERARAVGREVWVEGTTLHFALPRAKEAKGPTLVWGRTRDSYAEGSLPLQSFTPSLDARRQVSAVVVRGQDPLTREPVEGRAGEGSEDTTLGGSRTGPQVRAAALGGAAEWVVVDEPVTSQAEAEARARALYNQRAMEFVRGSGATLGLPALRAGTVVTLDGVGTRFNGQYYVTRSIHTIGGDGYRTSFRVSRNSVG